MGWDIVSDGLKAIFSKDIPTIVRNEVKSNIENILHTNHLAISDLKHYAVHPGGAKVLKEYEESLGLPDGTFIHSRKVLKEHGNMSSATVLYVINEIMEEKNFKRGEYGIISALGLAGLGFARRRKASRLYRIRNPGFPSSPRRVAV